MAAKVAGLVTGAVLLGLAAHAEARTRQIDLSACVNAQFAAGQPVGETRGNAATELAKLRFNLLDPGTGNNVWSGPAGGTAEIELSVKGVTAVYALVNTLYGQDGIPNLTAVFNGTGGARKSFKLVGNKTIRDFNNWVFTNEINGTSTQEWWTNNLNPNPQDQTHRLDVHEFKLGPSFAGQTLTRITFQSPADAAAGYMLPLVAAVNVVADGAIRSPVCAAH